MRIKESDLLKRLATDSGKTANQVAEIIISELLKNKVIEDTPENWGVSVFDAINEDVTEEQTANCYAAISEALGVYLKRVYFIVPDLDLMGNDDCPECGGEMEVTDGEYKQTGGDGYLTPAGIYRNLGGNDVYALRTQREQRTELLTIKD